MSTLSVTTINTANGTTALTVKTGNSSGPDVVLSSTDGITLSGNSTTNTFQIFANGQMFLANATANMILTTSAGDTTFGGAIAIGTNNKRLTFTPLAGGANVYFNQQNDDNFVFYSSNTLNQPRAIWSVFGNNNTAGFNLSVSANVGGNLVVTGTANVSGNLAVTANVANVGTPTLAANGFTFLTNGVRINWGAVAANSTVGTITYTSPFTAVYNLQLTSANSLGNTFYTINTNTSVAVVRTTSAANPGGLLYYYAIGT